MSTTPLSFPLNARASYSIAQLAAMQPEQFEEKDFDQIFQIAERLAVYKLNGLVRMNSPETAQQFLLNRYRNLEHEIFGIFWLTSENDVIEIEELFRGTIDCASVYPREVVKSACKYNASSAMLFHNHPGGTAYPSGLDEAITRRLAIALDLVEVRILDHIIVGRSDTYSFAEHGKDLKP